jgi:hypothetical protein
MTFLYVARGVFNKASEGWNKYIEWSKLTHLTEVVSLDICLNEILMKYRNNDLNYIHVNDNCITDYYTNLEYIIKRIEQKDKINLLMIVFEPEHDCRNVIKNDFEFIGYDLLDTNCDISALTNCGGFDETFLPKDLNDKGLIDDFAKAYDVKKRLYENNPDEVHADTNVIAIWRYKKTGHNEKRR